MLHIWLSLADLPPEGNEFVLDDPEIWASGIREFQLPYCLPEGDEKLTANIRVTPVKEGGAVSGCAVDGTLAGAIHAPCDRCARDHGIRIDSIFHEYQELPPKGEEDPAERHLHVNGGKLEFDAGGFIWEQLMLAMPVKPLCSDACQGLCPVCGVDLNEETCDCDTSEGDPRLAPLRNLKIS